MAKETEGKIQAEITQTLDPVIEEYETCDSLFLQYDNLSRIINQVKIDLVELEASNNAFEKNPAMQEAYEEIFVYVKTTIKNLSNQKDKTFEIIEENGKKKEIKIYKERSIKTVSEEMKNYLTAKSTDYIAEAERIANLARNPESIKDTKDTLAVKLLDHPANAADLIADYKKKVEKEDRDILEKAAKERAKLTAGIKRSVEDYWMVKDGLLTDKEASDCFRPEQIDAYHRLSSFSAQITKLFEAAKAFYQDRIQGLEELGEIKEDKVSSLLESGILELVEKRKISFLDLAELSAGQLKKLNDNAKVLTSGLLDDKKTIEYIKALEQSDEAGVKLIKPYIKEAGVKVLGEVFIDAYGKKNKLLAKAISQPGWELLEAAETDDAEEKVKKLLAKAKGSIPPQIISKALDVCFDEYVQDAAMVIFKSIGKSAEVIQISRSSLERGLIYASGLGDKEIVDIVNKLDKVADSKNKISPEAKERAIAESDKYGYSVITGKIISTKSPKDQGKAIVKAAKSKQWKVIESVLSANATRSEKSQIAAEYKAAVLSLCDDKQYNIATTIFDSDNFNQITIELKQDILKELKDKKNAKVIENLISNNLDIHTKIDALISKETGTIHEAIKELSKTQPEAERVRNVLRNALKKHPTVFDEDRQELKKSIIDMLKNDNLLEKGSIERAAENRLRNFLGIPLIEQESKLREASSISQRKSASISSRSSRSSAIAEASIHTKAGAVGATSKTVIDSGRSSSSTPVPKTPRNEREID